MTVIAIADFLNTPIFKTSLQVTRATEAASVLNYDAQKMFGSQLRQSRFDNLMNTFLLRLFDI